MPAMSLADSAFLASQWIGIGKKYADSPTHIQAIFQSLLELPTIVKSVILPDEKASVMGFISKDIPLVTPIEPLPDPMSYFAKSQPEIWQAAYLY
jgi:hypothetical protein